jgi:hypothetical protein
MTKGWGPEEHFQYWRDAVVVATRAHGAYKLVVERKPGRPSECSFAFAQCSIMNGPRRIGTVSLQLKDGAVVAWGIFTRDGKQYLLHRAPMEETADSDELLDLVSVFVDADMPFPQSWEVDVRELPFR